MRPPPNVPNREFDADAPNQKWVADVTVVKGAGAIQSMPRKGSCYDAAVTENFFGRFKPDAYRAQVLAA